MKKNIWLAGITGAVIGLSAAAAQAFFQVQPPVAYGFCMVCHPGTMVQWGMNSYFGTNMPLPKPFVMYPSLLAIGVFLGAFTAANRNKELRWLSSPAKKNYMAALLGFLIANFGLIAAGCPVRIGLLVSYGSVTGVILLAALVGGIGLACVYLHRREEQAK